MNMTQLFGDTRFSGSAPANSAVALIDDHGKTIAETEANENGDWLIRAVALEIGRHEIRAVVETPTGRHCESRPINVTVESEQSERDGSGDNDALRERAERHYCKLVEAAGMGFQIDLDLGLEVLELCGKSFDQFDDDVARWREISKREETTSERMRSFYGD